MRHGLDALFAGAIGCASSPTGSRPGSGGSTSSSGVTSTGGVSGAGGTCGAAGSGSGGFVVVGTGGAGGTSSSSARVRTIMPFDQSWLFSSGDPAGASSVAFDTAWRSARRRAPDRWSRARPALTGEFMWTGVDYLGEANGAWPTIGSSPGIMDAVGTPKSLGYSWQGVWGAPKTTAPAAGTTGAKIVLTPDHTAIVADVNDVSYVKATVADASGKVVTGSSAPVTFGISGPGAIIAVDSGSMRQESFRGTARNGFQGVAFAIVQATGAGTITVTASSSGLTGASATIQASTGAFVPCSGTCD